MGQGTTASGTTWDFPLDARQKWEQLMQDIGYVEVAEYELADFTKGYWCATCEYFQLHAATVTGSECLKFRFPDRMHGCCGGWEKKE